MSWVRSTYLKIFVFFPIATAPYTGLRWPTFFFPWTVSKYRCSWDSAWVYLVEFILVFDPLALDYEKYVSFPSSSCTQTALVDHNSSILVTGLVFDNITSICGEIVV